MYDDIMGIWDKAIAIFVICDHLHVWSFENTSRSFKPVVPNLPPSFLYLLFIYLFLNSHKEPE